MRRWIVLEGRLGKNTPPSEWEPAGSIAAADNESQAVSIAQARWQDVRGSALRAVAWEQASPTQRREAEEEDAYRASVIDADVLPVVGMCMLGVTTALVSEVPETMRALEARTGYMLDEPELQKMRLVYLALFYDCIYRLALTLPQTRQESFVLIFDREFRRLLYDGMREDLLESEIQEARAMLDEMIIAFGHKLHNASVSKSPGQLDGTLFGEFAKLVLSVTGVAHDSELLGQIMVRAEVTIAQLRLRDVLRPLSA
jgi:hypothetical protein